jgi:BirA family biotin operon repressor/biotin-[acetyl-CoA-carboxylase] ligase
VKTLFIGRSIIRLKKVDSTNNYAASLPEADKQEGLVIVAEEQSQGRGQGSKRWYSEPGMNLMATVLLRPLFLDASRVFALNKAVALAIMHALNGQLPENKSKIKWPNDLVCEGLKLAGILTENVVRGSQIVSYLAGFGVNVNQTRFPPEAGQPGSIKLLTGRQSDIDLVLETVCSRLEAYYLMLRSGRFEEIAKEYDDHLWQSSVRIRLKGEETAFEAQVKGVDAAGKLIVVNAEGNSFALAHGEAELL